MMCKTAALLAFVAVATAADVNVMRAVRQDPRPPASTVLELESEIEALGGLADALSLRGPEAAHLITQTVTNITEALGEETRTSMILSAQVASLMSTVTAQNAAYSNMLNETQSMAIAELDNEIVSLTSNANEQAADISSAVENMTADAAAAQSTAVVQMATLANSLSRSVSTQMAAGTATIAAVNRTASASLVGKMNTRKHHWTGGCSGHRNGGWNWFCLDRIESDTSAPWFRKQNNDRFVASQNGLFRINFFTINNACGWAHAGLFVQGRWVVMTHMHVRYSWWKDTYNDATFRAARGHYFGVRTHASCGHTSSYAYSSHGRIEGSYVGVYQ